MEKQNPFPADPVILQVLQHAPECLAGIGGIQGDAVAAEHGIDGFQNAFLVSAVSAGPVIVNKMNGAVRPKGMHRLQIFPDRRFTGLFWPRNRDPDDRKRIVRVLDAGNQTGLGRPGGGGMEQIIKRQKLRII